MLLAPIHVSRAVKKSDLRFRVATSGTAPGRYDWPGSVDAVPPHLPEGLGRAGLPARTVYAGVRPRGWVSVIPSFLRLRSRPLRPAGAGGLGRRDLRCAQGMLQSARRCRRGALGARGSRPRWSLFACCYHAVTDVVGDVMVMHEGPCRARHDPSHGPSPRAGARRRAASRTPGEGFPAGRTARSAPGPFLGRLPRAGARLGATSRAAGSVGTAPASRHSRRAIRPARGRRADASSSDGPGHPPTRWQHPAGPGPSLGHSCRYRSSSSTAGARGPTGLAGEVLAGWKLNC